MINCEIHHADNLFFFSSKLWTFWGQGLCLICFFKSPAVSTVLDVYDRCPINICWPLMPYIRNKDLVKWNKFQFLEYIEESVI